MEPVASDERPKPKWTPERRRQLTRDALVDAAREVFARRGFEGASLDEIAEAAGFTRGAIYKNFEGKADLFLAVFDEANEHTLSVFADMLENDVGAAYDFEALAAAWERNFPRDEITQALWLEFRLYELRNPDAHERSLAQRRRNYEMIVSFMEEQSKTTGVRFKLPIATVAELFLAAADGFAHAMVWGPESPGLFAKFLELFVPAVVEVDATPLSAANPAGARARRTAPGPRSTGRSTRAPRDR